MHQQVNAQQTGHKHKSPRNWPKARIAANAQIGRAAYATCCKLGKGDRPAIIGGGMHM